MTLVLAAALGLGLLSCGQDEGPELEQQAIAFRCADPCELYEIVWVGDTLLGDAAQQKLDAQGYDWAFSHLDALLEADYAIGNAEGPITTLSEKYNEDQRWHYNAQPDAAPALADAGFDAVGLANNHALDRGSGGLADTIAHLDAAGIEAFGAGLDLESAARPLIIETPYGEVAVLAFADDAVGGAAAEGSAGSMKLSNENLRRGHDEARVGGAEWVVAYVHWGENYSAVSRGQRLYAELLARAGYDLVVGHHPHVAQRVELIEGMPVLYSLGNFVFGTPGRFDDEFPGYGLVVRTFLGPDGLTGIELTCILTDNDEVGFQPKACPQDRARQLFEGLGWPIAWRDGLGTIALSGR